MPEDDAKKEQNETPEDKPLGGEPGKRDLEYGHAFGTQRDRSKGGPAEYFENYSDDWQDAVPDRDTEEE